MTMPARPVVHGLTGVAVQKHAVVAQRPELARVMHVLQHLSQ